MAGTSRRRPCGTGRRCVGDARHFRESDDAVLGLGNVLQYAGQVVLKSNGKGRRTPAHSRAGVFGAVTAAAVRGRGVSPLNRTRRGLKSSSPGRDGRNAVAAPNHPSAPTFHARSSDERVPTAVDRISIPLNLRPIARDVVRTESILTMTGRGPHAMESAQRAVWEHKTDSVVSSGLTTR